MTASWGVSAGAITSQGRPQAARWRWGVGEDLTHEAVEGLGFVRDRPDFQGRRAREQPSGGDGILVLVKGDVW